MLQLNRKLLSHLESTLPHSTLSTLIRNYNQQQENQHKKINTPATNSTNTSWRKQGNAIEKIKRKRRIKEINQEQQKVQIPRSQVDQKGQPSQNIKLPSSNFDKVLIKNKAVFFGEDCQLPYLHSSDAISHLYSRKLKQNDVKEQVLFNPPSSVDRVLITSLRSLHFYHTSVESLRQLGTGWSNLKELTIIYGNLSDLSGLSSFSSLEYLFVSFNKIESLSDLMFHPTIRCIDLEKNMIESIEEVEYLSTMDKLQYVNLNGNGLMMIKERRRQVQQKLGKILQIQQNTRLLDYQLQEMVKYHRLLSFENMQVSNALIKNCNDLLFQDEITFDNLFDGYQKKEINQDKINCLDFVRYDKKNIKVINYQESISQLEMEEEQEQEIFFTPLFHFINGKRYYGNILKKYLENKLYVTSKKTQNNQSEISTAHSMNITQQNIRSNKFVASTRLQKDEEVHSLDQKQSVINQLHSLDRVKRTRLSLGKTRKILQKFDKPTTSIIQPKLFTNLSSAVNPACKPFGLKRTTLTKKASINDLDIQIQKKFSKTASVKCEE